MSEKADWAVKFLTFSRAVGMSAALAWLSKSQSRRFVVC